ncbi:MAG: protein phosphatase 2C domain-containing protein [Pseudomonadales bacterium]
MITFSALTHTGRVREHNEDCYSADPELGLWLVADGIGGHARGEVASDIVKETIGREFAEHHNLQLAIENAHLAVLSEIDRRHDAANMGATVVALVLSESHYQIAWVGDSRAYLWDKELEQLSSDHTYVASLVENGVISKEEALRHPERNVITQSIGVSREMKLSVSTITGRLHDGQQLLLCSDGLSDEISDSEIALELRRNSHPEGQVNALLKAALKAGGKDNITIMVLGKNVQNKTPDTTPDIDSTLDISEESRRQPAKTNNSKLIWIGGSCLALAALAAWVLKL